MKQTTPWPVFVMRRSAMRKEADVEIVQPLTLWPAYPFGRAVGFREFPFLIHCHAGEAVVGRVAEDHEDGRLLFHALCAVAFFFQFGEGQRLGRSRLPAVERIGEEDTRALRPVVRQRRVEILHGEPDLQMGDDEGRGHNLETKHPFQCRLLHPRTGERTKALSFQIGGDAAQHFGQIGPGAAARVEHVDVLRREAVRYAEVVLQCFVHTGDHVADDFHRRVPDTQLLAQVGIEGFQERLVEVGDQLRLR